MSKRALLKGSLEAHFEDAGYPAVVDIGRFGRATIRIAGSDAPLWFVTGKLKEIGFRTTEIHLTYDGTDTVMQTRITAFPQDRKGVAA